jgi:hypothetical protein
LHVSIFKISQTERRKKTHSELNVKRVFRSFRWNERSWEVWSMKIEFLLHYILNFS